VTHCTGPARDALRRVTLAALLIALVPACATRADVSPSVDGESPAGVAVLYPAPLDRAFAAAMQAVRQSGLLVVETAADQRFILAEAEMSAMSYGAHVGVHLTPADQGTLVSVTAKRKMATNIFTPDYAARIHSALRFLLPAQARP
jgi:hypothetical protein